MNLRYLASSIIFEIYTCHKLVNLINFCCTRVYVWHYKIIGSKCSITVKMNSTTNNTSQNSGNVHSSLDKIGSVKKPPSCARCYWQSDKLQKSLIAAYKKVGEPVALHRTNLCPWTFTSSNCHLLSGKTRSKLLNSLPYRPKLCGQRARMSAVMILKAVTFDTWT